VPLNYPPLDSRSRIWILAGCIIGLAVIIGGILLFLSPDATDILQDCGTDKSCFAEKAQRCESATLKEDIAGTTVVYLTGEDCVLIKRFTTFGPSEPSEVRRFFDQRQMRCPYERGNFNPTLIKSIVSGIEQCEGDLKDAIYEVQYAQRLAQESEPY